MAHLLISYDATEAYYETEDFREDLISFLLSNDATDLHSYVESTIQFKTSKEKPVNSWAELININYNKKIKNKDYRLYFVLCRAYENPNGSPVIAVNAKPNLDAGFQKLVDKAKVKKK